MNTRDSRRFRKSMVIFAALLVLAPLASFASWGVSVGFGVAPGPGYVWVPGCYAWRPAVGYVWAPGRWALPPFAGAVWVGPHWGWYGHRRYFVGGSWGRGGFYHHGGFYRHGRR
jgi:hypothetical protein